MRILLMYKILLYYMADYLERLDAVFWITLATLIIGFLGLTLRYCFKSKCSRVSCCGITIERDIAGELEEERMEINNGINEEIKSNV